MPAEITIRAATAQDASVLVELRERMLRELDRVDDDRLDRLREDTLSWFAEAFPGRRAFGWIAERDGLAVGGLTMSIVITQPQYRVISGRTASVWGLYVEPAERGAGVATRLVRAAVDHAEQLGAELVTLHAAEKARPLYERIGFTASSEMRLFVAE